ncbi:hypothetical protein NP233_g11073 [Leucocoprinus birnbaumii]|uniref:Uncharacterized protein n=1 Tax=Leucocoprinus birnbaumii TaxID=56174 RepID=A0AAD5VN50_9AGAR|nr:hypothetical protein NP233_g11073 [Leucocoprinus birnbaumii]
MPESTVQQRIVPGAPPPPPPSKSQRKRRKGKKDDDDNGADAPQNIVTVEHTPADHLDVHQGTPAANTTREGSIAPEEEHKLSPIVELVSKRLKATTKKITRGQNYASMDPEKLDEDQKRIIQQLPNLEVVQKELISIKSAIETHEAELAHDLLYFRRPATSSILSDSIHLFANGEINTASLSVQGEEATAIYSVANALLGQDGDAKQAVLDTFLLGEGDWQGISCRFHNVPNHTIIFA